MTDSGPAEVRDILLEAGLSFARAAAKLPGVQRIAVIGSITTTRTSPKDIDFLVTVADDVDLAPLARLARSLQGRLQSRARGADVFLADERGRYIGRTCPWVVCRLGVRLRCDALHCGQRAHLHDDFASVRLRDDLVSNPPLELWPRVVRRCELPPDVEGFVARFGES